VPTIFIGGQPDCLPCCGPGDPVDTDCCPDVPRTLNYSITVATCSCLNGLTGVMTFRTSGDWAGYWASNPITLTGCDDGMGGSHPDLLIVVVMHPSNCLPGVGPWPTDQNDCTSCVAGGSPFYDLDDLDCGPPFSITVTRHMYIACSCAGFGSRYYCGHPLALADVTITVSA